MMWWNPFCWRWTRSSTWPAQRHRFTTSKRMIVSRFASLCNSALQSMLLCLCNGESRQSAILRFACAALLRGTAPLQCMCLQCAWVISALTGDSVLLLTLPWDGTYPKRFTSLPVLLASASTSEQALL